MSTAPDSEAPQRPIDVALCVGSEDFDRLGRILRHLVVGLVDQAVRVQIVSSDPRMDALALGPVQGVWHPPLRWPTSSRRIRDIVASLPRAPTVVHLFSNAELPLAAAIATAHDADLVAQVQALPRANGHFEWEDSRISLFVAVSEPIAAALQSQAHVDAGRVSLVRPGVYVSQEIASRARPWSSPTILCTAHFERGSGVATLLEAASILHKKGHEPLLFLLGRGSREGQLRRQAAALKIAPSVTFATPLGDPLDALRGADVFVRPCVDQAFHVDTLQAMGVGLATVTFRTPVADHLHHEHTALVCDEPTPGALADALERTVVDRAFTNRLATAARDYVRTHHSISRMSEQIAEIYRNLALRRATFPLVERSG